MFPRLFWSTFHIHSLNREMLCRRTGVPLVSWSTIPKDENKMEESGKDDEKENDQDITCQRAARQQDLIR